MNAYMAMHVILGFCVNKTRDDDMNTEDEEKKMQRVE